MGGGDYVSTHRNIDRICIVVLVLTLVLTVAFMNGEKLGITVIADEDAESYSGSAYFTANDLDGDWADNAYTTYITLDGSEGTIDGNGAYFLDGDLVISNGGWYVLSGTLEDGSIIVDAYDSSKIWIRLNGVTVNCSDDACLQIDQADKVFLTLAEGTENAFTSGSSYSEEALSDNTGGTIFSHDDLTVNGSGSLTVTAGYQHGFDVNDSLVITGGNITISAPQDGIHVNDSFRFEEASLTIDAGDDAVHSDDELYIESGTILIASCYEGLEAITIDIAGGDITIYPSDDGLNANGGNSSMDFGGGMGGGMGGGAFPGNPGGFGSGDEANGISGWPDFSDGEKPSVTGEGTSEFGEKPSETGEAASEFGEKPSVTGEAASGFVEKPSMADGMPAIPFGDMPQMSKTGQTEDGSSSDQEETYIRISGGALTIINETGRDADGLDSNGSIYIDGGTILISLPGDNNNCAIDYGSESGGECIVTGGTVLAFGASGMAEEFSSCSTQCAVLYNLDSAVQAGTLFRIMNGADEEVLSYTPACSYSSIAFSSPDLTVGETYTVVYGENSVELTLESTAMAAGSSGNQGGMQPGGMGGMQPGGMSGMQSGGMDGMQPDGMGGMQPGGMSGMQPGRMGDMQSGDEESIESGSFPAQEGASDSERPTPPDSEMETQPQKNDNSGFDHPDPFGSEEGFSSDRTEDGFTAWNELGRTVWLLTGASVLVLTAAVLFAMYYRKH